MRRLNILLADRLRLQSDGALLCGSRLLDVIDDTSILRDEKPVVVFVRKLGVDWQPQRRVPLLRKLYSNSMTSPESGRTFPFVAY